MHYKRILLLLVSAATLLAVGCTSIDYSASPDYVGFYTDGAKSVKQTKKTDYKSDELYQTFDDEFVYDQDGNVIKHIQTQYTKDMNGRIDFNEYVITYQRIGDVVLPESAALNGVVYLEVEYDLLPVDNEGDIPEYTSVPVFYRKLFNLLLFQPMYETWTMDLGNFDVPFSIDGKFVESDNSFDYYTGFDNDSVLTTGYGNILLQRFYYSREKYREGADLYDDSALAGFFGMKSMISEETTFIFNWEVKADKLIEMGVEVVERFQNDLVMNFEIEREFDTAARLVNEIWTVFDSRKGEEDIKTLYTQELSY
ncbi:MAG TPA: hypothetical protein DCO79_07685 [Spirochaeta sp.]|nr:hypothetical protein [Spirochaeta sp.]